jgi:ribosomal-protein-serine acetyltransferase
VGKIRRHQRRVLQEQGFGVATACGLPVSRTTRLRLLDDSDAPGLHALIEANRGHLARWFAWAAAQTSEDTRGFIRGAKQQVARNDGFQAGILREGELVGVAGYHAVDWRRRSTSIGYWLGERFQGEGTMTESVRLLVDHALSVWSLNRVEIRAAAENRRSRQIPERLGFREEGTLREAERVGDRALDSVVYSTLARDWLGLHDR